jgi:hypothetical protein
VHAKVESEAVAVFSLPAVCGLRAIPRPARSARGSLQGRTRHPREDARAQPPGGGYLAQRSVAAGLASKFFLAVAQSPLVPKIEGRGHLPWKHSICLFEDLGLEQLEREFLGQHRVADG